MSLGVIAAHFKAGPTLISAASIYLGAGTSHAVPIPSSAAVGDLLICAAGHGWAVNLPNGWTDRHSASGSNVNGRTFSKACASGEPGTDLTVTTSDSYAGSAVLFVVRGGVWRTMTAYRTSSHSANTPLATGDATAVIGDLALYFAHFRPGGNITYAHGSYDSAASGSNASGRSGHELVSATSWGNSFQNDSGGNGSYGVNIIIGP